MAALKSFAIVRRSDQKVTRVKNLTNGSPSQNRFPASLYDIVEVNGDVRPGWVRENGVFLPPVRDREPEPKKAA